MTFHHPAQSVTCNGATIPFFGLGTWELRGAAARSMVREAIAMGIRHIDTARFYDNERVECEIAGLDRLDLIDIDDLAARPRPGIVERPERAAADRPIETRGLIPLEQDRTCLSAGVRGRRDV